MQRRRKLPIRKVRIHKTTNDKISQAIGAFGCGGFLFFVCVVWMIQKGCN